jgi:hypothetical protein
MAPPGLAATRRADEGDLLPRLDDEGESAEHLLVADGGVGEVHVLELNLAREFLRLQALHGSFGVRLDLGLGVHQL